MKLSSNPVVLPASDLNDLYATGGGLMDSVGLSKTRMSGWAWKIEKNTKIPTGLKLVNDKVGHYSLMPAKKMTMTQYIALLEELVIHCERYQKV